MEELDDTLAEGIATVMAASDQLDETPEQTEEMADLFLGELNRLWTEPLPGEAA
ncbi:MAG: hypothetical protein ABI697_09780 [Devosia sp.]